MAKGGVIYEIKEGKRQGQVAFVSNEQPKEFIKLGKVRAYFFTSEHQPILSDGRHENGIISVDKLKVSGFYD